MNSGDFTDERFRKLLDLYFSQELQEEEMPEFEEYLKKEEYRDTYIKFAHQDSVLYQLLETVEIKEGAPINFPGIFKVIAVAILLIAPVLIFFSKTTSEVEDFEAFSVSHTINCTWNRDVSENGKPIELLTGIARLNFQDGSSAVIEAPVSFKQVNSNTIFLEKGNIFVTGKPNFTVLTEKDKIVDIGTEFGVSTGLKTIIQVHKGLVALSNDSMEDMYLKEGSAIVSSEQSIDEMSFLNSYFLRGIPTKPKNAQMAPNAQFPGTVPYNINSHKNYVIHELKESIVVDANLKEWHKNAVFSSSCRPPFADTHSIQGQIKYNEKGLYIGLIVNDPYPMNNKLDINQESCWNAGSQQLWFAHGNERVGLTLLYSSIRKKSYLLKAGNNKDHSLVQNTLYEGKHIKNSDTQYSLEYFISWEALNFKVKKGEAVAFHLTSHWSDKTGRYWNGFLEEFQNFEYFNFDAKNTATWGNAEFK